jgi:hypothetical protein
MKLSQWKLLPALVAVLAVAAGLAIGSGTNSTSAISFNPNTTTTVGPLNVDTSRCVGTFLGAGGSPVSVPGEYHTWGQRTLPTCVPGTGLATRTAFADGSVLATPAIFSYTSGMDFSNLVAATNGQTIGTIKSDIDLFCNGTLDQLAATDIEVAPVPSWFTGGIAASTPWNTGHFDQIKYAKADILSIDLAGGLGGTVVLPNPVTLSFFFMKPNWTDPADNVLATLVILGGDPNPPTHPPLCTQSPQRATTHYGFVDDGTGAALVAADVNPFVAPGSGRVLFWDLFHGASDYRDGLSQVGPAGGVHMASGFTVPAHVLRNVHCSEITGGACPAVGSSVGQLFHDGDGDGLPNVVEEVWGSNPLRNDTSNNGLTDFEEMVFMTNPLLKDTDGDAAGGNIRSDANDNCPLVATGTSQTDTSGNLVGDACTSDRDGDGMLDGAETGGIVMVYADNPIIAAALGVASVNTFQCRSSESMVPALGALVGALEIFTDPNNPDTDGDGINDGAECALASAPGNSAATGNTSVRVFCGLGLGACGGTPLDASPGSTDISAGFGLPAGSVYDIGPANASRPQLGHSGADNNGDGHVCPGGDCNTADTDRDGLPNIIEVAERTSCVRVSFAGTTGAPPPDPGGYLPPSPGSAGSCIDPFGNVDNPQFMGFGGPAGVVIPNFNGQGDCVGVGPPFIPGAIGVAYEPVGTVPAFPASQRGCDGPTFMASDAPAMRNQDGDGMAVIKSTSAPNPFSPVYGSNRINRFTGGTDGCTMNIEAGHPSLRDGHGRTFPDVTNNQVVSGTEISRIKAAFGSSVIQILSNSDGWGTTGIEPGAQSTLFKRTLDVAPPQPGGTQLSRGNGVINASDISRAKEFFGLGC